MAKRCLTHLHSHDLVAIVRAGIHELGALPYQTHVDTAVEFDFAPLRSRLSGRLVTSSPPSTETRDDREVRIWLEGIKDDERTRLVPGVPFKVLAASSAAVAGSQAIIGVGEIKEVSDPCDYEADAEVVVELALKLHDGLRGRVFEFAFPKLGKSWTGHLDASKLQAEEGHPLSRRAHLCLHNLVLSQSRGTPGGQPFDELEAFALKDAVGTVGCGTIARLLPWNERVLLCKPIWSH